MITPMPTATGIHTIMTMIAVMGTVTATVMAATVGIGTARGTAMVGIRTGLAGITMHRRTMTGPLPSGPR